MGSPHISAVVSFSTLLRQHTSRHSPLHHQSATFLLTRHLSRPCVTPCPIHEAKACRVSRGPRVRQRDSMPGGLERADLAKGGKEATTLTRCGDVSEALSGEATSFCCAYAQHISRTLSSGSGSLEMKPCRTKDCSHRVSFSIRGFGIQTLRT